MFVLSMRWPNKRRRGGSFLVEAILAIVILSISLTLIIQSLMTSLKAAALSADYTRALLFIDDKMFDLIKDRYITAPKSDENSFSEEGQKYRYQLTTERGATEINLVKLVVSWVYGRRENDVSITTFLFNPPSD